MQSLVICGVESADAEPAGPLHAAAALAKRLGDRLVLAHVLTVGGFGSGLPAMGVATTPLGVAVPVQTMGTVDPEEEERTVRSRLAAGADRLGVGDAEVIVLRDASPADGLRRLASEREAEMIVVGTHGHGAVRAALLGSTSHALAGNAPCPVLLVSVHQEAV